MPVASNGWIGLVLGGALAAATGTIADPSQPFTQVVGSWKIQGRWDAFDNSEKCASNPVSPPAGTLAARIGDFVGFVGFESASAKYKVDDGPIISAALDLLMSGTPSTLVNSAMAGGAVLIPLKKLLTGKVLHVRSGDDGPVKDFNLSGLAGVVEIGERRGCSSYVNPASFG